MKNNNVELVSKYIEKIKSEKKLSEGSIRTYKNIADNLPFSILLNQKTIISKLKDLYKNPNTLQLYLNMIILIRRYNNESFDLLVKLRNNLKDDIIKERKKNLDILDEKLPTKKYVMDELNNLNGIQYIINYLILNHGLRNKDMNLKIVLNEKDVNDDDNFLIINKNKKNVKLIINDYKTEKSHGSKIIKIDDLKFFRTVYKMYLDFVEKNENSDLFLITLKNGSKIKSVSTLNDRILSLTIDKLGQNKLFKIIVKDLLNHKNFDLLEQLSKDRGTSLSVMLKSYNLENGLDNENKSEEK